MEGRAIARPDHYYDTLRRLLTDGFNGGPGNCPAGPPQRAPRSQPTSSFNGGPGNCPAGLALHPQPEPPASRFNGGPGNCPAGLGGLADGLAGLHASMEGRAIARPDFRVRRSSSSCSVASMEGRAIARPDVAADRSSRSIIPELQWRAGQLPGRTGFAGHRGFTAAVLQWRAGQLPGRTRLRVDGHADNDDGFNGGPGNCPAGPRGPATRARHSAASMEGRAIARPDPGTGWGVVGCHTSFNGGPGNCPAGRRARCGRAGPTHASMEGRAIARPDRSLDLVPLRCPFAGACERSGKR